MTDQNTGTLDITTAAAEFTLTHPFLNTATYGLGCREAVQAMSEDLDKWRDGRFDIKAYDQVIDRGRVAFAALVGAADVDTVAIISQLSQATSLVAASLRPGDEVVVAEEDFTSILFPFLAREVDGVKVTVVPLDGVIDAIRPSTTAVAVSAVQSADGRVLDLDALAESVQGTDTMTFVDVTQAAGWLPIDADRFTVTAAGAYKWLCSPRGSGFMTVRPEAMDRLTPNASNWYATDAPWESAYGPPFRPARNARRYDLSPAWSSWVGTTPTVELLAAVGVEAIHAHDVGLASIVRDRLGLAPSNSAIVAFDMEGAGDKLSAAGISAASPSSLTRLSFHLYNTEEHVEAVLRALG